MTNEEYLKELTDEVFGPNLPYEQAIRNKKFLELEQDVDEFIEKDFAKLGCDTSTGEPTWLGFNLWMESKVNKKMKEKLDKKYRKLQ